VLPTNEKLSALRHFTDIEQAKKLGILLSPKTSNPSSSEKTMRRSLDEDALKKTAAFP